MISRVYISHSERDEDLALELSSSLWRIGLESYSTMYFPSLGLTRADKVSFGIRNSECMVVLISHEGQNSVTVGQEIGLARGIDLLIIPLLEHGAELPFLLEHLRPITFNRERCNDAIGILIKTLRDLSGLKWLKVKCPECSEEMTQYLTSQEEVDRALERGFSLETICSYCQNKISLDPRTFAPIY